MRRAPLLMCAALLGLLGLLGTGWLLNVDGVFSVESPLPHIGPAPDFRLVNSDGQSLALAELRGKIVVVTFIYTRCPDECPLLTAQLAALQSRLGLDFGARVYFVSISVDPEHDTPPVLAAYARQFGADLRGWAFLTGDSYTILPLARRYGLLARLAPDGSLEHSLLTSIIDRNGIVRVQYLGTAFDPGEMLADIQGLVGTRP